MAGRHVTHVLGARDRNELGRGACRGNELLGGAPVVPLRMATVAVVFSEDDESWQGEEDVLYPPRPCLGQSKLITGFTHYY
jgi:hypothetical protein